MLLTRMYGSAVLVMVDMFPDGLRELNTMIMLPGVCVCELKLVSTSILAMLSWDHVVYKNLWKWRRLRRIESS